MLNINHDIFNENLLSTQAYCDKQLSNTNKNFAAVFRSINPTYDNKQIFDFKLNRIAISDENKFFYLFLVDWRVDPYDRKNLYEELYETQLQIKRNSNLINDSKDYEGQIFIFEIDETLIDGAAAVASHGLLDNYNCPPIDSWFYLTKINNNRILFAWIPKELTAYAEEGISVNPEGCIKWFKEYNDEIIAIKQKNKRTKFMNLIHKLPKFMQR